jgi:eukaryotic-like serine/threonine-protein kinase
MATPETEENSFNVLDAYLEALQAGKPPDRAKILAAHPEMAGMLDCMEGLEELAPEKTLGPVGGDPHATIDARGQSPGDVPMAGQVDFGKYEIVGEIGRGGMGVIYKARQKDLDRPVAIKMILSSQLASPQQVERFTAESRAMARLHHPNIVRIHETGAVNGQHFFVMEFITGPSLAEELRKGRIGPERAAQLVALVARAVQHLHEQGIVHRDLKPSNVLLDEKGQPYVTDFGLVKMLGSSNQTTTGAILGTPAYMAPEQATGRPDQVGPHSDVYSLGAILYELVTGRPPFQSETALDTLVQVIESEPTRPRILNPILSRHLENICMRCLEKDPTERYTSAGAVADDLERFLKGELVEARPGGLWAQLRRWARREPTLVYRLAALATFIIISHLNYHLAQTIPYKLHVEVLVLLGTWILASVICQQWLKRESQAERARLAWVAADVTLLTTLLAVTGSQADALLVGYPFLIAASGLWFQVHLVWFTTAACEAAYLTLILGSPGFPVLIRAHYHMIFMVALLVEGFVVAYQVQRIRVLNRYYENRPLP